MKLKLREHVAVMGETRNSYRIWQRTLEKMHLKDEEGRWEVDIKTYVG
jgi:hypothetical protein